MIEILSENNVDVQACTRTIETHMNGAALYEQLAEEAAELAQAALKVARICRGENPTPMSQGDALRAVIEELSDVAVVMDIIGVAPDQGIKTAKLQRWAERIREAEA